ncbi:unnamed protein product [Mytilus edulis]|uniref:Peptidase A2 domain-containing protein n=1 Tax=Mytilus edulis TaxID=6550 RepID=A0A8S3T2B1_MYTED|nr:unnamed protein product [Mytilus edulis]
MLQTYREDEMLYDPYSDETRNLTRELNKLNKEIGCLRSTCFENAPDFAQSTPISQATRQDNLTLELLLLEFRTPTYSKLRGQAQGVLGNIPTDKRQDFKELVRSLEERFSPANQTELYRTQLRKRRQKAFESLPDLGQAITRLTNLAYPTAPNEVRETLAKEQFIDGLMSVDMRLRIKQARPADFNDAIRHAVELEAFNKAEIKQDNGKGYSRAITRDGTNSDASDKIVELLKNMQTALSDLQQEKDCPESSVKRGHSNSQNVPEFSREKQNGVIGVNKLANEAGMFIEAKVHGCKAKMLIDTGATVSLISKKLFDSMGSHVMSPMDREILTTNGSPLILFRKTIIDIEINGIRLHRNNDVKIIELRRDHDVYSKDGYVNREAVSENDSSENEDDDIKEPDTNVKTSDKVCLKGLSKRKTTRQEKIVAPKQKELFKYRKYIKSVRIDNHYVDAGPCICIVDSHYFDAGPCICIVDHHYVDAGPCICIVDNHYVDAGYLHSGLVETGPVLQVDNHYVDAGPCFA